MKSLSHLQYCRSWLPPTLLRQGHLWKRGRREAKRPGGFF